MMKKMEIKMKSMIPKMILKNLFQEKIIVAYVKKYF